MRKYLSKNVQKNGFTIRTSKSEKVYEPPEYKGTTRPKRFSSKWDLLDRDKLLMLRTKVVMEVEEVAHSITHQRHGTAAE